MGRQEGVQSDMGVEEDEMSKTYGDVEGLEEYIMTCT